MKKKKELINWKWIATISITSFIISMLLSAGAEYTVPKVNLIMQIFIVIAFIAISILFDMISIAVTTADEAPFHSMNSRRVKGANVAIQLLKNRDKVASLSADVIGDVCGIITGAASVTISLGISSLLGIEQFIVSLTVTAILAAMTIGGKAIFKPIALANNKAILYRFCSILAIFYRTKK